MGDVFALSDGDMVVPGPRSCEAVETGRLQRYLTSRQNQRIEYAADSPVRQAAARLPRMEE